MQRWLVSLFLALTPTSLAAPANAQANTYAESLNRLQQLDARVQTIGWRLARGNAPFCADTRPAIGLLMQDIMGYNQPAQARAALAVPLDFAVQAVAAGSPAEQAGLIANQPLSAVDSLDLSKMAENAKALYMRLQRAERAVQESLDANGSVALTLGNAPDPVNITGVTVCKARFVVRPSDGKAAAYAETVYIGGQFPGLAYADDELAAAMAHELAHIVLRHPQWIAEKGRKGRDIKVTERDADRLMPWLLANAGYDPQAAVRFMKRWGQQTDSGLLKLRRTHDGWDERAALIEAELPLIRAALARDGFADWSARFSRKPDA